MGLRRHRPVSRLAGATAVAVIGATVTVVAALPASAIGGTFNVSTTSDIAVNAGACGNSSITTAPSTLSLREATCLANNVGGAVTINVPAGTYRITGELQPGKAAGSDISIVGAGAASTIVDAQSLSRVFDLDPSLVGGVTTTLSGMTIEHGSDSTFGGGGIIAGSGNASTADQLTLDSVTLTGNQADVVNPALTNRKGGGLQFEGGKLTITNSVISNNSIGSSPGSGVYYESVGTATPQSLSITNTTFQANTAINTNGSSSISNGGALAVAGLAGTVLNVSGSRFLNNTAAGTSGPAVGAGIWQENGALTVTGSTFTGNSAGGSTVPAPTGGAIAVTNGTATLHFNRIVGNSATAGSGLSVGVGASAVNATENWWGCNAGPGSTGCDTVLGTATTAPRLVLTATASPATIVGPSGTSTITGALTTDSSGSAIAGSNLGAFDGLPVTFADPAGDAVVGSSSGPHNVNLSSGAASITYHSNTTTGSDPVDVTFDNQTSAAALTVDTPPAITSADAAHFVEGTADSFTVTTTGVPHPAITKTGSVPPGMSFADNGDGTATVSGTPTSSGSFPIDLTASNGVGTDATQTLTLTVGVPAAITSPATADFTRNAAGSFDITTSGTPAVNLITEAGPLPAGLIFTDHGDGTATIAGTPTDTAGAYPVSLTASNGSAPDAMQTLTINVNGPPSVTLSPTDQTVQPGTSVTFTAAASGFPAPTVQWQVSTDNGGTFSNIASATSTTLTFTAAAGDDGNQYRAVFTNPISSDTTTAATLRVGTAPAFTSAATTTFVAGQAGTFSIATTGVPDATLTHVGAGFPAWLTFTDNGGGTGSLTGTPPAGSGGPHQFELDADNGFSPSASQNFTLTVDEAPTFTSIDHVTFTPSTSGLFAVTTTPGYPIASTLSETGSLPSGVTFHDNGDGSGTLAGTPAAGTGGSYPITFAATATGGGAAPATQAFTLTVNEPPVITSADNVTFDAGNAGTFTVTTVAGNPTNTAMIETGALPSGVTFTDNGDGTATIAGTPDAGTGGLYTVLITAANGVDPNSVQAFTLTVDEPPTITSPDHASFTVGTAGSFSITTTGFPVATSINISGALPTGLLWFNNADGTATIIGTPAAGTGGTYPLSISAINGLPQVAQQSFTLTVLEPPSITSIDHATMAAANPGLVLVTTTAGFPVATTVTETGALPTGVQFTDNGDGSATLTGTPDVGTGGTYPLTIKADNGVAPAPTQSFTLTVVEAPDITSADHTSFAVGAPGTFTVTTTPGFPTATTITESGSLPSGVTFVDNGDGTATLAGTPAAGTQGNYPMTIFATNSFNTTPELFTLTVERQAQTITTTSLPPTQATVGDSFTPAATSDSGLPVAFSVDSSTTNNSCALNGSTLSFDHLGSCVLDEDQAGDGTYLPAAQVQHTIDVVARPSATVLTSSVNPLVYGQPFQLIATVTSSGGPTDGTVQFMVDGVPFGAPVTVSSGTATSPSVTDSSGHVLTAGGHAMSATFTPVDTTTDAPSTGTLTQGVNPGATATAVHVNSTTITANVGAVAPAAGTPTGSVSFLVGGQTVGSAPLVSGAATLAYQVPTDDGVVVAAIYGGDTNFSGSSASTARNNPTITATLSSAHHKSAFGWYRSPVTVTFTCVEAGAPLTAPCPSPVTLSHDGAAQSVTRTVTATDGGVGTVVVSGINIDQHAPKVTVTGIHRGKTPAPRCKARDRVSGVASCVIKLRHGRSMTTYRAIAKDRAGNKTVKTGRYATRPIYVDNVERHHDAYVVRAGHAYTLVATGFSKRPVFFDAVPSPDKPSVEDGSFHHAGNHRWAFGLTIAQQLRSHSRWNIGVKIGSRMHTIALRIR